MARAALLVLLFLPAAALAKDTTPPDISLEPVQVKPGGAVVVSARIVDPSGVFSPTVYWRGVGHTEFQSVPMTAQGSIFSALLRPAPGASAVQYFIEAYDDQGNGPARIGQPTQPIVLDLTAFASRASPVPPPSSVPGATPVPPATSVPPATTVPPTSVPASTPVPPSTKAPNPTAVPPATSVPGSTPGPADWTHTLNPPEPQAWKLPTGIGAAVVGVGLVVGGLVLLMQARQDASTFNTQFAKTGSYSDSRSQSISTRQAAGVGLTAGGVVLAGAGAGLLAVRF